MKRPNVLKQCTPNSKSTDRASRRFQQKYFIIEVVWPLFVTMSNMQLAFVRHGRTNSNELGRKGLFGQNDGLNTIGREQIERAANILDKQAKPEVIICSPYLRTRESADILAAFFKVAVEIDGRIQETDVGDWKGQVIENSIKEWLEVPPEQVHSYRPPNGETWLEIGQRVVACVEDWAEREYESVLFVSHREPIRCGIGVLLGEDPTTWTDASYENGSVSLLQTSGTGYHEVFLNRA